MIDMCDTGFLDTFITFSCAASDYDAIQMRLGQSTQNVIKEKIPGLWQDDAEKTIEILVHIEFDLPWC